MKFKILILFFLCLIFLNMDSIYAEKWQCAYIGNNGNIQLTYEFDNLNNKMEVINKRQNTIDTFYNYSSYVLENDINSLETNECPIIHLAYILYMDSSGADPNTGSGNRTHYHYYSFDDSLLREQKNECVNGLDDSFDWECLKKYFSGFLTISYTSIDFYTLTLDQQNSINEGKTQVNYCYAYRKLKIQLEELYKSYSHNKDKQLITDSQKIIGNMKKTCRTMLSHRDLVIKDSNGNLMQDPCVPKCLQLEKEIKTLKNKYNISTSNASGVSQCGISQKLAFYIANIVKWLKYIIPVIVIVLGILDFIKAIAADKDDEMKKAQGKFIKRLIAAALIFIVPFIIEFVLDKMGFGEYVSGCGIIDL